MDPRRQVIEQLVDDSGWSFHQDSRLLLRLAVGLIENRMETVATLFFEMDGLASGEASQVADDLVAICKAIFSDGVPDEGLQNLLSATAADAECQFESGPVYPRGGKCLKLPDGGFQAAIPYWFIGHK
jgi:hypothetical protein